MFDRPTYVNAIMRFVDAPVIKVLTGIRRSGKSTILLMLIEELKKRGMNSRMEIMRASKSCTSQIFC